MADSVAVIITARNAEATIGGAVSSALDQPEVSEVVLVDDASSDGTGAAALAAARSDGRLTLLTQTVNLGPAAARNLAIIRSSAPFVAILDADDYLLPGRFGELFRQTDWDLIADNIVFVPDTIAGQVQVADLPQDAGGSEVLGLADFVLGNVAQKDVRRGELGFLKPVIRRSALQSQNPVYDPALWLGEDYDLYVRLLLAGARMRLTRHIGYAARVRADSLSGQHRTKDLRLLLDSTHRHIAAAGTDKATLAAMRAHQRQLRDRYLLRAFLDTKAEQGIGAALGFAMSPLSNLLPITLGIAADKRAALRPQVRTAPEALRILLPIQAAGLGGTKSAAQAPASSSGSQDRL